MGRLIHVDPCSQLARFLHRDVLKTHGYDYHSVQPLHNPVMRKPYKPATRVQPCPTPISEAYLSMGR